MPRKEFQIGEVLTAANVNTFLMDQAVMSFDDDASRGSAIPTPVEGMATFRNDDKAVEVYANGNWNTVSQATGPNYIINGAFDVWQRGTSFSSATDQYTADRWQLRANTSSAEQSTDTPFGAGFSIEFMRTAGSPQLTQYIEAQNSRLLAGQTVTISYYAKEVVANGTEIRADFFFPSATNNFATVTEIATSSPQTLSTSWQRFSFTATMPQDVDKGLRIRILPLASNQDFRVWGVQLEAGSVATPFKRHAPDVGLEELACQRYYWSFDLDNTSSFGSGFAISTTSVRMNIPCPVQMRANPSIIFTTDYSVRGNGVSHSNFTISNVEAGPSTVHYIATVTGATQNHVYTLVTNNNIQFISELT